MTHTLTIRPAQVEDAPALARVHVDTWRTTYGGIVPDDHLANLSYERSQARWVEHLSDLKGETVFAAVDDADQVVGFATGGPLREALPGYDGELYAMYILKAYQGEGCGRRLVAQVARALAGAGYRALVIWALKENPACGFYQKLGGVPIGEKTIEIGGKSLVDVAFGWPDLAALL